MNKKKSLKTYLAKAQYLIVVNRISRKIDDQTEVVKHQAVHIPVLDFHKKIRSFSPSKNPLQRCPSGKQQADQLKRALINSNTVKISLLEENPSKGKAFDLAKVTSRVSRQQDLHLLHFGIIYYSARKRENKAMRGWKVPRIVGVTKQLQYVLKNPIIKPPKGFIAKFSKVNTLNDDEIEDKSESFEKGRLALEKEYSHRRNYRTSSPLHT